MMLRRILFTGTRDWTDRKSIETSMIALERACQARGYRPNELVLVHGTAGGADTIAAEIAKSRGWQVEPHPITDEHRKKYGVNAAPIMRNEEMAKLGAWCCLAAWNGERKGIGAGTIDCFARATKHGIPTKIIPRPR